MSFFRTLGRWVTGQERREFIHDIERLRADVFAVPNEDARTEALRQLSDPRKFRCVPRSGGLTPFAPGTALSPLVLDFFTRYDQVEETMGDVRLSRMEIGWSLIDNRFVRIGTGTEHSEIVVQPGKEDVYTIDGLESETSDGSLDWYPTLYHFILMSARMLHPNGDV